MCKEIEKVLSENAGQTDMLCEVTMDGSEFASNDFVAILSREDGSASFFYNTDAVTLGMAMKMVARAFVDSMAQLTEEERQMVSSVLGNDFDAEEIVEEVPENA